MADKLWQLLGVSTPFDSSLRFVSSSMLSPLVLAILRLVIAIYTLVTLLFILIWDGVVNHNANRFFSYFTELTYIGLCTYFWASGIQTTAFALDLRRSGQVRSPNAYEGSYEKQSGTYPLQRWPKTLQFLHTLLWSTITTFPFLVTVVFWALLAGPTTLDTRFNAWSNISIHALNSVFALFEILVTRGGPQPWLHIPFLVLILAGYLGVAYITHATQGFYPYGFLDPKKEGALLAAYIVGIPVAAVVIFSIVWLICQAKVHMFERSERGARHGVQVMRIKV